MLNPEGSSDDSPGQRPGKQAGLTETSPSGTCPLRTPLAKSIQSKKESMEREIKSEVARKSIHFSKAIIKQAFTADSLGATHDVMIEEISQQIGNIDLGQMSEDIKEVEIVTIFPLGEEKKEMLKRKLSSKLKKEIELKERIDDSVMAGILIKLGSLILDGSLANKLRIATEQLEKE